MDLKPIDWFGKLKSARLKSKVHRKFANLKAWEERNNLRIWVNIFRT